jgi:hypothetical protein
MTRSKPGKKLGELGRTGPQSPCQSKLSVVVALEGYCKPRLDIDILTGPTSQHNPRPCATTPQQPKMKTTSLKRTRSCLLISPRSLPIQYTFPVYLAARRHVRPHSYFPDMRHPRSDPTSKVAILASEQSNFQLLPSTSHSLSGSPHLPHTQTPVSNSTSQRSSAHAAQWSTWPTGAPVGIGGYESRLHKAGCGSLALRSSPHATRSPKGGLHCARGG